MKKYEPKKIEKRWQKKWDTEKLHETKDSVDGKKNFYKLVEFPYPSGNLHMGHWYAFSVPDILARFKRMQGYNVLYPMGFDAFGLPAENAAIKNNLQPSEWTKKNIKDMSKQMVSMGTTFDWSRMVSTIDPDYYKWTQWIFLQFYKNDLAYRSKTKVNWCPKDKTVLANEQVVENKCDRCGSEVEQREREQWMYRITKYADKLLVGLDTVDWPEVTKTAQRNWIGKSEGAEIDFSLKIPNQPEKKHSVKVFTTRPDTIFGATFIVVSPELAQKRLELGWQASDDVKSYIKKSLDKREQDRLEEKIKTGIFAKIYAINPANKEEIPVWIADYVLGSYGTGAIMAVPAHDERDFEFAKKYNLKIKKVIVPPTLDVILRSPKDIASGANPIIRIESELFDGEGELINSGKFSGMDSEKVKWVIVKEVGGRKTSTYRLRDWILSRQRYWGTPIPMINCEECGYQPVPEEQLPIKLPKLDNYLPADDGSSPLARAKKWVNIKCPKCSGKAKRETDTMDTFVDSSWYFMRYTDPNNEKDFALKEKIQSWCPVDVYTGGSEHTTMHLLYSRFFTKALHDLGYINFDEPFKVRRNHGIVLGPDGNKMSKSKGNVIDPDKEVEQYGADSVRMYLAFLGPYDTFVGPWNPQGITGIYRFLNRVLRLVHDNIGKSSKANEELKRKLNGTIKKVGEDIEALHFNTAIAELMKLLNDFEKQEDGIGEEDLEKFLLILAPFAPHITEELWHEALKHKSSIHLEKWPEFDAKSLITENVRIAVQINGKTRSIIEAKKDISEEDFIEIAKSDASIVRHLEGKKILKTIFIKDKLLSIVVS